MSHWTWDTYGPGHTFSVDLQDIEDNFAVLKGNFSSVSAPASATIGMDWFDTTKKILKIRNQGDTGWLGVFYGNTDFKVWFYLSSAEDGWVQDASITDKVLAVKGGSTYVTGGTIAGSWTIAGNSLGTAGSSHNHYIYKYLKISWEEDGVTEEPMDVLVKNAGGGKTIKHEGDGNLKSIVAELYSEKTTHEHSISSTGAWRVAASVGILCYPKV